MIRVVTQNTPLGLQRTVRFDMTPLLTMLLFTYLLGVWTPDYTTKLAATELVEALTKRAATGGGRNTLNQIFWLVMFMVTSLYVLQTRRIQALITVLVPFLPFIAWILASTMWSEHVSSTMRRAVLTTLVMATIASVMVTSSSVREFWRGVYGAFWVCCVMNIVAIAVPACYDTNGLFRGIYGSKNIMGMISSLGILMSVGLGTFRPPIDKSWRRLLMFVLFTVTLALSLSKTSIALTTGILLLAVGNGQWNRSISQRARVLGVIAFIIFGGIVSFFFILNMNSLLAELFDKFTFTGRTAIWSYIDSEIDKRYVLGTGYGAFWGIGPSSPPVNSPIPFIRMLNQAHNGYMDLHVQTGIIGLLLFVASIIHILVLLVNARVRSLPGSFLFWSFIYFGILHNLLESTAWRGPVPVWIMFVSAALSLTMSRWIERQHIAMARQRQEAMGYRLA